MSRRSAPRAGKVDVTVRLPNSSAQFLKQVATDASCDPGTVASVLLALALRKVPEVDMPPPIMVGKKASKHGGAK